ncbi:hypothetical protein COLO4_03462 [Corchorus olitorius]|uniref:Uncharacterized protein n=1 Tax=Corchorus olitorius TaxID=93759 RepID=A0A1R3KYM3_9ROSI|nr:hypothetical protein COLO4_03462 [Corchorus olitorius]
MASLVLLVEALMMRCQKEDLLSSNKVAKETDSNTNHIDAGKQGQYHMIRSCILGSNIEDTLTWKTIAECCIWP